MDDDRLPALYALRDLHLGFLKKIDDAIEREVAKQLEGLEAVTTVRKITVRSWRVEEADIVCFGLANPQKLDQALHNGRRNVSIAVMHAESPFYEAVALPDHEDWFSIVAVWVPLADVCETGSDFIVDTTNITAALV